MLTVSENAATVIKALAKQVDDSSTAGLRIGAQEEDPEVFAIIIAQAPLEGDEVVESDGSRVFLDPATSPRLSNKQLDAIIGDGSARFSLRSQD
nr:Fe-S cluster assembly protein HesB [Clavibacter michiganensis]